MTSLKTRLHEELKKYGHMSWDQMEAICREEGKRTETGRRKLEKDQSPRVEHVLNDKNHIIGYRWIEVDKQPEQATMFRSEFKYI